MAPYVTPFCQAGSHENSRLLSKGGALLKSCSGTYNFRFVTITCNCWCHEMFASICDEGGLLSSDPTNNTPDAAAPPVAPASADADTVTPDDAPPLVMIPAQRRGDFWSEVMTNDDLEPQVKRLVGKLILNTEVEVEPKTDSVRRARGSLEINAEVICRLWLAGKLPYKALTPQDIALLISAESPPSEGAIHAVLTRWNEQGFAEIERNPVRFVRFTQLVDERGIAETKRRLRREMDNRSKGFF